MNHNGKFLGKKRVVHIGLAVAVLAVGILLVLSMFAEAQVQPAGTPAGKKKNTGGGCSPSLYGGYTMESTTAKKSESDGGKKPCIRGKVILTDGSEWKDKCEDQLTLKEYYYNRYLYSQKYLCNKGCETIKGLGQCKG